MAGDNHNENHNGELSKAEQAKGEHRTEASAPRATAAPPSRGVLGTLAAIYHTVMKDGSIAGLFREGLKDIQDTYHEVAWGQGPHGREPGAPLTPLHADIEEGREQHAARPDLPSPGDIAKGRNFTTAEREGGQHGQETQYAMGALFGVERAAIVAEDAEAAAAAARAAATAARAEGAAEGAADATAGATADGAAAKGAAQEGTEPSFVERELERDAKKGSSDDQNYRARGRSLADEQRAQQQERDGEGRGR